jgi:type III secretion protein L
MTDLQEKKTPFSGSVLFTILDKAIVLPQIEGKILTGEAFGSIVNSQGLLKKVQQDGEEYRAFVARECESIKAQAEKEGFDAGYNAWAEMVRIMEKEIKNVREELQKSVMSVALRAAKKIVSSELETRPEVIVDIVMNTLKTVAQHKRIVLYVGKKDYEYIEKGKNKIKAIFEELETLSLREREDIEPGGCIVETESGIINARMEDRWRTIEAAFEALSAYLKEEKEAP